MKHWALSRYLRRTSPYLKEFIVYIHTDGQTLIGQGRRCYILALYISTGFTNKQHDKSRFKREFKRL